MIRRRLLRRDHSAGQTLVEFALVLPLLVVLLLGILDFGRVIFLSNDASHAAREATRYASVNPKDCDSIYGIVQEQTHGEEGLTVTVSYRLPPSFSNTNPPWDPTVCPAYNPATTYDTDPTTGSLYGSQGLPDFKWEVQVRVVNPVAIATPIISTIVGGTVTVTGASSMVITFVPS